jgi:hypothetical protein
LNHSGEFTLTGRHWFTIKQNEAVEISEIEEDDDEDASKENNNSQKHQPRPILDKHDDRAARHHSRKVIVTVNRHALFRVTFHSEKAMSVSLEF